LKLVQK